MLTAAQRGCPFTSTRTITVLKFNSALRYLSYLSPDDDEQREALALALEPDRLARTIDSAVADAASSGNYMTTCHPSEHDRQPGEAARINAVIRGIDTPVLQVFDGPTVFPLTEDPRALDWYGLEGDAEHTWRWSGPNPRPRLLLPFAHAGPVRVTLHIRAIAAQEVWDSLEVFLDRRRSATVVTEPAEGVGTSFSSTRCCAATGHQSSGCACAAPCRPPR